MSALYNENILKQPLNVYYSFNFFCHRMEQEGVLAEHGIDPGSIIML